MRFFFLFPVVSFLFLNPSHSTDNLKAALDAYDNAPSYGRGRLIANVISCSRSFLEQDICTNSAHDNYEDLEKQVEELVGDKESLTIELSTVRLAKTSLNTQLITSKGLLLETERDLLRARDRIEVLVEDNDELTRDNDELTRDNDGLTRKIEELNLERANLLQKLEERKASCVELEGQLREAEKAQQDLKDLQSSLTEERDQLLVKISLAADVETARLKELKEKKEDLNKVAEQLEISRAKIQTLARGMTLLQAKRLLLEGRVEEVDGEKQALIEELNSWKKKCLTLQGALQDSEVSREGLLKQLSDSFAVSKGLSAELNSLKALQPIKPKKVRAKKKRFNPWKITTFVVTGVAGFLGYQHYKGRS